MKDILDIGFTQTFFFLKTHDGLLIHVHNQKWFSAIQNQHDEILGNSSQSIFYMVRTAQNIVRSAFPVLSMTCLNMTLTGRCHSAPQLCQEVPTNLF